MATTIRVDSGLKNECGQVFNGLGMTRGKFITFEGPEGSGKSTHIRLLRAFLEARGVEVAVTREPGGTPLGEAVRNLLQHDQSEAPVARAEVLLFLACRAQHVERLIRPALDAGTWVLCDRFDDSTMAYQGYARGFDLETLSGVNGFAVDGLRPDLTVLLDVSPGTSRARLAARGAAPDRIEREQDAFHVRVRDGFLALARREPGRFAVVNTEREQGAVERDVRAAVMDKLGIRN
ncbi:MAG: dTMP kinase [Kiritimatiellaeota bacterium]|nr:dTMP kinase [Kiritimatiellota bacterium]